MIATLDCHQGTREDSRWKRKYVTWTMIMAEAHKPGWVLIEEWSF